MKKGQLLIEVVLGLGLLVIVLGILASFTGLLQRTQRYPNFNQAVAVAGFEKYRNALIALSENNWDLLNSLASNTDYYLYTSGSGWFIATGTEIIKSSNESYNFSFRIADYSGSNVKQVITTVRYLDLVFQDNFLLPNMKAKILTFIKKINLLSTGFENFFLIKQTSDYGYILGGYTGRAFFTDNDILVIKLYSDGNLEWAKTIGGSYPDLARSIQQTSDNGYILAGYTYSFGAGYYDILVVKLSADGNLEWAKTIGGSDHDFAYSIQQTSDNGYILAGYTYSFGAGYYDILVVKLSADGNLEWAKTIGGTDTDEAYSIQQTSDNGYILGGKLGLSSGSVGLITKLYSSGNVQWAKILDQSSSTFPEEAKDGGYFFSGSFSSIFGKLDSFGNCFNCSYLQPFALGTQDVLNLPINNVYTYSTSAPIFISTPTLNSVDISPNVIQICPQ